MAYSSSSRLCRWVGGGIISLLAVAGPLRSDTYIEWKARVFTEAEQADPNVSGETALSPAGDGIPNLLKYAFGIDPHQDGSLALPQLGVVQAIDPATGLLAKYGTITYQVSATNAPSDLYFVPEISLDLQSWARGIAIFGSPIAQEGVNPGDPSRVTFQALQPNDDKPKLFLRLRVVEGQTLPDDWQITNFGHVGIDPAVDADGDGRTNFDEFLQGTDPNDYYNGRSAQLVVVSGNNQAGLARAFLPAPLVVQVRDPQGNSMANAPLRFSVLSGGGNVCAFNGTTPSQTVELRTDAEGKARAGYLEPDAFGLLSSISASVVSRSISAETVFYTTTLEGLIIEPRNIDVIVNAGQSNMIPVMIANETSDPVLFSASVENGSFANLSYSDSDQPLGPPFAWSDIRQTGTLLTAVSDADDDYEAFDIGFAFPYFGNSYTTIYVSSNGFITLGEGSTQYSNTPLPDQSMPSNEIAAFHTDLNLGASGDVYYQEYPDRVVIQFTEAARYAGDGNETFQIVLQRDGTILFYYLDMNGAVEEATVGIQNAARDAGLTVAYQTPYLKDNLAVRITSSSNWLNVSPFSGNLGSGESVSLAVLLNQAGLTTGNYQGTVHITAGTPSLASRLPLAVAQSVASPMATADMSVAMNINGAPQVTLLEPATEVTVRLGDALELRASAQDPNGISRIEFYDGADKIAEGSASPYVFSWNAPGGRHVITAHAVDSLGAIGASPHVAVNKDTDSDNDGLGDEWEMFFFGNLDQQGDGDSDSDGATNLQEYRAASLPNNHDTDADGVSDGDEINVYHTNATAKDTDGDGMDDGWEVQHHLNPTANDADDDDDHDGLTNKQEFAYGTDPMKPDTDGDHVPDGIDGWPLNEAVAPPRLPIFRYAILDITQTRIWAVNNSPDGVAIHPLDREGVYFPSAYLETADDHLISPNASNDLGRTVGSIAYTHLANGGTTFGPPHACILPATHDGSATPLFLWGDSNQSFAPGSVAVDINNAGQVLIQSISSPSGDWIHHGAIWQDGEVTDVAVGDPVRINQQGTVLMADFITKRGQPLVLPFPPNDLTDSYADDTEAVIGSGSHGGEIWRNGKSAALPVPEGTGDPYRINNRVQIFGDIFTRPGFAGNAGIWQNGQFFYIRNLIPQDSGGEWDRVSSSGVVKELRINDRAMIIVRANHVLQDGSGRTAYNTPFLLMPVELMVDANRDGQMSFTDAMIHDADQTEEARPYRFWLNDDDDTELNFNGEGGASTGPAEGDKVPVPRPDHSLHQIVSKRNLEDFSRLWIYLGGLQESIKSGDIQIGLRWRNVASGNAPAINIYPSADEEGSSSYLTDETAAQAQISGVYNDAVRDFGNLQTIGPHDLFLFKKDYWNELSADQPRKCLLFEGAGEGKGELEIVFFNRNFDEIGRGGSLWLDLKNVKRMYERAKASPDPLTPLPFSLNSGSFDEGGLSYTPDVNPGFEQPEGEQEQCLIFVHGWRMSYSDSVTFSEIMFKRLWWQGFAGRFVAFRWGTQTSFDSYNTSEWLAWKYGKSLRDYVEHYLKAEMPTYSMNVAAHSMGNIVTGSALRRGMRINAYMLMEAAVPSGCFNDSVNNYNKFLDAEMTSPTPDSADEKGYRLFLESVGQNVTKLISFFNIDDYALATGTIPLPGGLIGVPLGFPYATNWEKNQVDFKPNRFNAANSLFGDYLFTSSNPVGRRVSVNWGQTLGGSYSVSREVTDIHESMAFAARPRSKAAGAELHNASVFGSVLNLESSCNFGADFKDHGGQFLRGIQELGPFYSRMNEELKQ